MHNEEGLSHLDIKPDNFVINDDFTISLIDFGHTTKLGASLNVKLGTNGY